MNCKQSPIRYKDVVDLGFKEQEQYDQVYFDTYGYRYTIIKKKLSKNIYIDWEKETRLCSFIRVDNKHDCNIMAKHPVKNLTQLKTIMRFFKG